MNNAFLPDVPWYSTPTHSPPLTLVIDPRLHYASSSTPAEGSLGKLLCCRFHLKPLILQRKHLIWSRNIHRMLTDMSFHTTYLSFSSCLKLSQRHRNFVNWQSGVQKNGLNWCSVALYGEWRCFFLFLLKFCPTVKTKCVDNREIYQNKDRF